MAKYRPVLQVIAPALAGILLLFTPSLVPARAVGCTDQDPEHGCANQSKSTSKDHPQGGSTLFIGDRLKIVFYTKVGRTSDRGSTALPDLSSLIEHPELTGEYIIQLDGTIFLPLVGAVDASGLNEQSLVATLEERSREAFNDTTKVSIQLIEREPVYVTGDVPQPSAFKYSPGMVVLHAAGLAGLRGAGSDVGARLAVAEQSQRLREAQLKLADLLAQRDVLVAKRSGTGANPSEQLKSLVGASEADERIVAAKRVADLETDRLASEQKALDESLTMLIQERSSLTQALTEAETSLKFHAGRFESVSQLHNRGVMTDATYGIARGELDSSRARWNDLRAALTRVEQRILEVSQQKSKSIADTNITRERTLNDIQSQIQQSMVVWSTLEPVLAGGVAGTSRAEPHYRIVRRSLKGLDVFDADKFAQLQPGDIVQVIQPSAELNAPARNIGTVGRAK